jgi:Mrp family chromosome partitioning ATPase/capsular polysaccharide biosynthesis protein
MSATAASMSPADYGRALRRRWPVVALLTVVGLAGGYLSAHSTSPAAGGSGTVSFQSTSYLSMPMGQTDPSGLSLDAMAFFATNGQVPIMAAKSLHYKGSPARLAGQVQAKAEDKIGVLEVSAGASSPSQAAAVVRAFDNALIGYLDAQIQISSARQVADMRSQVLNLRTQIQTLQAQRKSGAGVASAQLQGLLGEYSSVYRQYEALVSAGPGHTDLHEVQSPTTYAVYSKPKGGASAVVPARRSVRTALGGGLGLLVGLALALGLERLDTRVRTRAQAEAAFGLPVLAQLPRPSRRGGPSRVVVVDRPASPLAESYRVLQTLMLAGDRGETGRPGGHVVLVASPLGFEGEGVVVANLAASFRDAGSSVVILAANAYGRAELPGLLGLDQPPGPGDIARSTAIEGVRLATADRRGGSRVSPRTSELMAQVRGLADVVLVQAAPVLLAHDAAQLASQADAVVLLCSEGGIKAEAARLATATLRQAGAPLVGVSLVEASRRWRGLSKRRQAVTSASWDGVMEDSSHQGRNGLGRVRGLAASRAGSAD